MCSKGVEAIDWVRLEVWPDGPVHWRAGEVLPSFTAPQEEELARILVIHLQNACIVPHYLRSSQIVACGGLRISKETIILLRVFADISE